VTKSFGPIVAFGILFGSLATSTVWSQQTTATIAGTVTDETDAVLPGALVLATHTGTGISREAVSDDEGRYRLPNLGLGEYRVEASLAGFQSAVRSGITLTIGREAVVNFSLKLGEITEHVEVTSEASLVETTQSSVGDLVDTQQIQNLPLNARSFTDLAFMQAGVWSRTRQGTFSATGGGGSQLSIAGSRSMMTSFLLDGSNIKDMFGTTPGSAAATMLGVDAVREFQVMTTNYSAEFGGAGGVIHSVTKSGTNDFDGTVFWFHRNDNFDASNFFDQAILDSNGNFQGKRKPEFNRNQYGFSLGGRIVRDRTFFFGNFEGLRDREKTTNTVGVPSAESRTGDLLTGKVTVDPAVKPYLDLFPLPNTGVLRDANDRGDYAASVNQTTDEDYFMVRVDHRLSDKDSLYVRYKFDHADKIDTDVLGFRVLSVTRTQYATIESSRIFSPMLFNTLRFSYNRSRGDQPNLDPGLPRSLNFFQPESLYPDRFFGRVNIGGITALGTNPIRDRFQVLNLFQVTNNLRYNRGDHALSFGTDIQRSQVNATIGSRLHGAYNFPDLEAFLTNNPRNFEGLFPGTGTSRGFRQSQFGFFAQDDWRVTSKLTMNLGLRWEFTTIPTEVGGRLSNLRDPSDPEFLVGDPLYELSKKNFAPRIGVAYDPSGAERMAIRAGFGIFHQQQDYVNNFTGYFQSPPFFNRFVMDARALDLSFPVPFQSLEDIPATAASGVPIQFDYATPYMMQYNLSIQRQLWANTQVTVSYVGTRGVNLVRIFQGNINNFIVQPDGEKFFPAGTQRMNPNFQNLDYKFADTNSSYNSLQLRLNKRFSSHHQYQFSYTFSKTIDECASGLQSGSSGEGGSACMDPFDPKRDRGLSGWDVRHNFSSNLMVTLPGENLGGALGVILGGWNVNTIVTLATGSPLTAGMSDEWARSNNNMIGSSSNLRPNLAPGGNKNPVFGDGRDPNRYLETGHFVLPERGFFGDLGRTTIIGPGLATVDLSFTKTVPVGDAVRTEFRAEFFNLLNRANFGAPNATPFTAAGRPSANFGRITSTDSRARQIQFGLKLYF
jgi:hypothetical protein